MRDLFGCLVFFAILLTVISAAVGATVAIAVMVLRALGVIV